MANEFFESFLRAAKALEANDVDYVLIGGFAVILHGLPRLTEDMDIFVNPESKNIEKLKKALNEAFQDPSIGEISTGDLDQYPVVRYGTPKGFVIDIITRIGEMFRFADLKWEILTIEGQKVKVATPETLFRMKKDTVRERDKTDAVFLRRLLEKKTGGS